MGEDLILIAGVTLLCMLSPGPDMLLVMRNSLLHGRHAGLWTALGVLFGNLVHCCYCLVGIGVLISSSIVAFNVLKWAGAAYLIYLGISSLLAPTGIPRMRERGTSPITARTALRQGLINNLLNPKATLFFLGVFSQFVGPTDSSTHQVLLVATMLAVSSGFWLLFICGLQARPVRTVLVGVSRSLQRFFGGLLVALGLRVAMAD